jgi:hypothetical protein
MSGYCQVLVMTGNKTPNVSMTFAEHILHSISVASAVIILEYENRVFPVTDCTWDMLLWVCLSHYEECVSATVTA